jgi:hypothetical protein
MTGDREDELTVIENIKIIIRYTLKKHWCRYYIYDDLFQEALAGCFFAIFNFIIKDDEMYNPEFNAVIFRYFQKTTLNSILHYIRTYHKAFNKNKIEYVPYEEKKHGHYSPYKESNDKHIMFDEIYGIINSLNDVTLMKIFNLFKEYCETVSCSDCNLKGFSMFAKSLTPNQINVFFANIRHNMNRENPVRIFSVYEVAVMLNKTVSCIFSKNKGETDFLVYNNIIAGSNIMFLTPGQIEIIKNKLSNKLTNNLYSVTQTAKITGLSKVTIHNATYKGELKYICFNNSYKYMSYEDIQEFMRTTTIRKRVRKNKEQP